MKKKLLITLTLIIIIGIIFPLVHSQKRITQTTTDKDGSYSYIESFPWDLKMWEDASLKCTNEGTKSSEILVSLLGENDSEAITTSFKIPSDENITKRISKLTNLGKKQKGQNGILLIKSKNSNISCKIINLPFTIPSSIESTDIVGEKSYIISTPKVLKNITEGAKGRIIIYNLGDSQLNLEVQSYTQVGVSNYQKQLKAIGSGKKKVFNLKNINKKNATYYLIPKRKEAESFSHYFAYLELTDQNGKKYLIKNSQEVNETLITNTKGTLVISNISSVPINFTYAISSGNKKAYQGNEWLMPHGQRIFNLRKHLKKLSSPRIRIKAFNFFKDKECENNEKGENYECFYSSKKGLIAINFYTKNTHSPKIIKNMSFDESSDIPGYDILDYLTPDIPVKCYKSKDSDQDGLCDFEEEAMGSRPYEKDSDNDGLNDGVEVFHNFSSPNIADTDDDGYDDFTEYKTRALAFSLISYPGSPSPYSDEGMRMINNYYNNLDEKTKLKFKRIVMK